MTIDLIEFLYNCEITSSKNCIADNCKYITICINNMEKTLKMIYSEGE